MKFTSRKLAIIGMVILVLSLMGLSISAALPPSVLVIETGPVGGSYHDNALLYAKHLEAAGVKVEIRPNPQSLQTIDPLNADLPRSDAAYVDVGFTVQPLVPDKYPNVLSAGVVQMQPLFIFYNRQLGQLESPIEFKGRRVVMPPQGSASAQAATALMAVFGVNDKNTRFTYLPIAQAAQELKDGLHDGGFFMLASSNALVREMVMAHRLMLMPIREAKGVTRVLDNLRPALLPFGAFDMKKLLPEQDLDMISGSVNVMVRKDINPAVLYSLLQAMKETHSGQTLVSIKGEFPTMQGTSLKPHPLAVQWEKAGTPWMFSHFGLTTASLIDQYWVIALGVLFVANLYSVCQYLFGLHDTIASYVALRILYRLHLKHSTGQPAGAVSHWLFDLAETMMHRESIHQKASAMLHQVKPVFKPVPTGLTGDQFKV
jgi:NMT1-like family